MNPNFNRAVDFVLGWEGGYVNDPDDPGGKTKWGISKRSYPDVEVENLTREAAADIYKRDYWDKCCCGDLHWPIAIMVFDEAVNQGVNAASVDLQSVSGAKVDGIIGPKTLAAVQIHNSLVLAELIAEKRVTRYKTLVVNKPEMRVFIRGWIRRVTECLKVAKE